MGGQRGNPRGEFQGWACLVLVLRKAKSHFFHELPEGPWKSLHEGVVYVPPGHKERQKQGGTWETLQSLGTGSHTIISGAVINPLIFLWQEPPVASSTISGVPLAIKKTKEPSKEQFQNGGKLLIIKKSLVIPDSSSWAIGRNWVGVSELMLGEEVSP